MNRNLNQGLETRWVGPTNYKGSRVVATVGEGKHPATRHVHAWDYSLGVEGNHYAAADALRAKLDWPPIKAGCATRKGYAFATGTLEAAQ